MTQETYSPEQMKEIIEQHRKWRYGEPGGVRASLDGARLDGASLDGASLDGASLDGARLDGASLDGASLDGASLVRASLDGASLDGASLVRARLVRASLDGARLDGASLDGASLDGARLDGASLDGASLDGASLDGASLDGASLDGADLSRIKADFFLVLDAAPSEVAALLAKLREGKIDGRVYQGACACLVGTIANVRGCSYDAIPGLVPNGSRFAEKWFTGLAPGQTPAISPVAKITEQWIKEWFAANPKFAPTNCATCGEPGDHADLVACVAALKGRLAPAAAPVDVNA